MRPSGPYEVKPRQLRALVVLLMLVPLIPTAFVVRFMVEAVSSERLEARERARPVYQKFLESIGGALSANVARRTRANDESPRALIDSGVADAVLVPALDGRLLPASDETASTVGAATTSDPAAGASSKPAAPPGAKRAAEALARAVAENGVRLAALPTRGEARWRFLSETPEPIFALYPHIPAEGVEAGSTLLLVKTRQHLLEMIRAFYQKAIDPQSRLVLLDENGEIVPLVGPANAGGAGEPLAEAALKPPLPLWRVQLFGASASLADSLAREQFVFYFGVIGGVLLATVAIGALAGLALTRRIDLHEMSNDALAVVAHEMKTPLAGVRMFVDTLLERRYRGGPAQADEYLRLIAQENERLERLVEGFLTLSRLERNPDHALTLAPTRARAVADAARERLRARLEGSGCHFQADIAPDLPPFPADAEALTVVLVNLLDNALKYSGDDKRIALKAFQQGECIIFEVRDNGIGIPREEQGKVFQRFYQADRRLARSQDGSGLGLSIVQSLVRAHGGSVSVESALGRGSVFTVKIPARGRGE